VFCKACVEGRESTYSSVVDLILTVREVARITEYWVFDQGFIRWLGPRLGRQEFSEAS
jgi:hypothetical protein